MREIPEFLENVERGRSAKRFQKDRLEGLMVSQDS